MRKFCAAEPGRRMAPRPAEARFESLDALRIVQCDVRHLWRFHPSQSFFLCYLKRLLSPEPGGRPLSTAHSPSSLTPKPQPKPTRRGVTCQCMRRRTGGIQPLQRADGSIPPESAACAQLAGCGFESFEASSLRVCFGDNRFPLGANATLRVGSRSIRS